MTDAQAALQSIQARAAGQQIRITQHAQQEMAAEAIRLDDVVNVLSSGRILEN